MKKNSSIYVKVRDPQDNSSMFKAISKFKNKCNKFGITKEYRNRKEYNKPSVLKKKKRKESASRRAKNNKVVSSKI